MSGRASVGAPGRVEAPGVYWLGIGLMGLLGLVLFTHAVGACLDFIAAVRYPYELDYGEGIVWQQAVLMAGPRMYAPGSALPFIVFHYPPLFHMAARGVASFMPDLLSAGRAVSVMATLSIAAMVAALVLVATRPAGEARPGLRVVIAVVAGLLVLCLHGMRTWGLLMRVDMVAIALGLAGVLVAAQGEGRFWPTTCGLLLCVAAVYAKQTQLPAGMAVFVLAVLRRPRMALGAGAVAGVVGLGVLAGLQVWTGGGFLQHILGYNINRFSLRHAFWVFWPERTSLPVMALIVAAAGHCALRLWRQRAPGPRMQALRQGLLMVRLFDRAAAARAMLLLYFGFASAMLVTIFKIGSSFNYLLDWMCVGCVLVGIMMCDFIATRRRFVLATAFLLLTTLGLPLRQMPAQLFRVEMERSAGLVERIAAAPGPVASEDMTLLMRAGKAVIFEPAIVTELAAVGRWDETPLLDMIRGRGFSFMVTTDNVTGGLQRRSPAVDAAMRAVYPRVEQVGPKLWFNLPP